MKPNPLCRRRQMPDRHHPTAVARIVPPSKGARVEQTTAVEGVISKVSDSWKGPSSTEKQVERESRLGGGDGIQRSDEGSDRRRETTRLLL